jgi:hypothetical protein
MPTCINHGWTWRDGRIHTLLEEATQALGELNACSLIVPDVDLFISLHVVKEYTHIAQGRVMAGTTGYRDGDAGHGGRTIVVLDPIPFK